jgi:hypothetical protein
LLAFEAEAEKLAGERDADTPEAQFRQMLAEQFVEVERGVGLPCERTLSVDDTGG